MPSISAGGKVELNNYWLILHNQKKVFAPVSKNANTSLKRALLQGKNDTEFATKDHVLRKYLLDYTIVCVVRNPFDRLVSCYSYFTQVQPGYREKVDFPKFDTFEEFVQKVYETPDEIANKHFRSQYNLLSQDGVFLPDKVFDFDDLSGVGDCLHIPRIEHKHKTSHGHYRQSYNDKAQILVEQRFWKDLQFFNYEF